MMGHEQACRDIRHHPRQAERAGDDPELPDLESEREVPGGALCALRGAAAVVDEGHGSLVSHRIVSRGDVINTQVQPVSL